MVIFQDFHVGFGGGFVFEMILVYCTLELYCSDLTMDFVECVICFVFVFGCCFLFGASAIFKTKKTLNHHVGKNVFYPTVKQAN